MITPFTERLKQAVNERSSKPVERLRSLIEILSEWSNAPAKRNEVISFAENLTPIDVKEIKNLISDEIKKINFSKKEDVAEQLLFNIVGALRNAQKETLDDPWRAAKLNANFLLSNSRRKLSPIYLSLATVIVTTGLFVTYIIQKGMYIENKLPEGIAASNIILPMPPPVLNPYIPSHFYSLREKMSKATCQFPQAAVLPPEQRAAFLAFINTGEITLSELSNLQAALAHVSCQYMPLSVDTSKTGLKAPGG